MAVLPFWHICSIHWELPWILIKDTSGLPLTFSAWALESAIFPLSSASFYWRLVFRNQDLGTQCAHCCKAVVSRPSQWIDLGNRWMFTYTQWTQYKHTWIYIYLSVCLSVIYLYQRLWIHTDDFLTSWYHMVILALSLSICPSFLSQEIFFFIIISLVCGFFFPHKKSFSHYPQYTYLFDQLSCM